MTVKSSDGPRYAPEDPSLPKPWRGLVDGKTGYLYFWNPVTNVTQYERPSAATPAASDDHDDACGHINRHQGGRVGSPGSHTDPAISRRDPSDDHARGYSAPYSRTSGQGHGYASASSGEAYRRQHEITVIGDDAPDPFTTFESAGFPSEILREVYYQVHQVGFSAPTPIQAQSWPIALSHRDVVAVAKTGSGKTLGYLIPAFIHLKHLCNNSKIGPVVLVLSPTRELATQIQEEAVKFGRSSRISSVCLYGGAPKGPQLRDLSKGADIVVATPGRLNDILEMKKVSLHQVSYLVLDEADRMLDMGFEPQIQKIVKEIPPRRQTLMFTATWPKEVRKIAADLLVNPIQVNIGNIDELVANKAITQYVEVITPMQKQRRLGQILNSQEPGSKIIIFCSTKRMCDQLARALSGQFGASAIHGDKSQSERDWVLNQFRTGRSPILVATDVAARGLDIKDIRVVINYDFPTGVEDYVHRIGRTGRAGATGISYTFFCDQDSKYASDLIKVLEGASQHVPSELRDLARHSGYGGNSRRWRPGNDDHNGGRFHGGTCSESSYDGGGGWGQPLSSGWSDSFASRPHSPPLNRYDRADGRGCHNPKSIMAGSETFGAGRGRSRSANRSRSPYRGCSEWGGSESPVQKLWTS